MTNFDNENFNVKDFLKSFTCIKITILQDKKILILSLNRPNQLNALNEVLFIEIGTIFQNIHKIAEKEDIRVIVLNAEGKAFSSGLDLNSKIPQKLIEIKSEDKIDISRKAYTLYNFIKKLQENLLYIETCPLPVIAAVHGYCLGGAMSILAFCDIRLATKDSVFSVKEVDIGLTADLGFIQKIVKQTGKEGLMKKLTFTGEKFLGDKALAYNIVDEIYENKEEMDKNCIKLAEEIAKKSPIVLWGIKRMFNFSRDNNLGTSLDMVASLNSALIQGDDMVESIGAFLGKRQVKYPKL